MVNKLIPSTECKACHRLGCSEHLEEESLPYGDEGIIITVTVPVIRCNECNFVYTDQRAERIRHSAVAEHLGILTADQIIDLRKNVLGMSRDAMQAAFGLSKASLERWENGKLLQNVAADTLLRALQDPSVARRVDRSRRDDQHVMVSKSENVIFVKFPSLSRKADRAASAFERSRGFNLQVGLN